MSEHLNAQVIRSWTRDECQYLSPDSLLATYSADDATERSASETLICCLGIPKNTREKTQKEIEQSITASEERYSIREAAASPDLRWYGQYYRIIGQLEERNG